MQTEILRIIEGGLAGDKVKVFNYASTLADNLEREGDGRFSKRIRSAISGKRPGMVALDGLSSRPVDQESRMEIVDVECVTADSGGLILNKFLEDEIKSFIALRENKALLENHGIEAESRLLLYGPPGCGKTSIARLIAFKTGLPLVTARLDGLVSSLLGSTAKNIRKIFDFASRQECVLFLDEFDVVAKRRDDANELGELKRVVNSLIQNIDCFDKGSILIAATNHHDLLDPAVWRRFNKVIEVPTPGPDEIERYVEAFVAPFMKSRLMPRQLSSLDGLSFSDMNTVTKNAVCDAVMRGESLFNVYDLIRQTYVVRHHGVQNIEDLVKYMLEKGCPQADIQKGLGISLRTIKTIAKSMKQGGCDD